ncbi:MAG: histidine kinase [Candidatus Ozemobacter sibiricus]|uniref:Histidine kinase n=1 Tax=Candidatus Ozemobacter sibiricus TaxID=2268124 RepID=A0A367ZKP2_9BACT|nr:MAG: histidine kinase [Candidatus Ozemobacter sibiricus]
MLAYSLIRIYTSERARFDGKPLWEGIIQFVAELKIAARCFVSKGLAGCFENGEVALPTIEVLAYDFPLRIDVLLPTSELPLVLPELEEIVTDGLITVDPVNVVAHKSSMTILPMHLRVRSVMTADPTVVAPETPLAEAVRLLLARGFNGLPVVDARRRPVGILTQGDLMTRGGVPLRLGLLSEFASDQQSEALARLAGRTVAEIMTSPVMTVAADQPLSEAVKMMLDRGLKRLPVVGTSGEIVGMLARSDVFRAISRESPDWDQLHQSCLTVSNLTRVRDVMDRDLETIAPDTPVAEVLRSLSLRGRQRAAVVDREGRLLGLLTDKDLLSAFSDHKPGVWAWLVAKLPFFDIGRQYRDLLERARQTCAADFMRKDLVTVHEDAPIDEAIRLMTRHHLKRLPVVDSQGIFRGLIGRDALLRANLAKGAG